MKKFIRKVGVILATLLVFGVFGLMGGCDNTSSSDKAMIGDVVSDKDGVEFCITNVTNQKSVGEGYFEEKTDNNFIVVTITINNGSNEPYDVNSLRFLLVCDGAEYEYASDTLFAFDNFLSSDTVNPHLSKEYTIVFETPTTTMEDEYVMKIKPNAFVDRDCVYIVLKND